MSDLETLIGVKVNTAVRMGSLFVPANSLVSVLHRYVEPALFLTNLELPYEFTKSGSLTRIKYRSRYFALVCSHQVESLGYSYEQFILRDPRTNNFFTSHRAVFQIDCGDHRKHLDLLVFEFTEIVAKRDLPDNFWYDLSADPDWKHLSAPRRICCIGYPSAVNDIDYVAPKYAAKAVAVWGTPAQPTLQRRLTFRPESEPAHDPHGMSGGGVFCIAFKDNEPIVLFSGILTDATKSMFNYLSVTQVRSVIDTTIRASAP